MHLFTIYLLDSHGSRTKAVPWGPTDYDYIKECVHIKDEADNVVLRFNGSAT
jgi:hypothetical protein